MKAESFSLSLFSALPLEQIVNHVLASMFITSVLVLLVFAVGEANSSSKPKIPGKTKSMRCACGEGEMGKEIHEWEKGSLFGVKDKSIK